MSRGDGQDVRQECLSRHLRRRIAQQLSRVRDYRLYRHPSCWRPAAAQMAEATGSGMVVAETISALTAAAIPPQLQQAMGDAERAGALSGLYHFLLRGDYEAFDRAITERMSGGAA